MEKYIQLLEERAQLSVKWILHDLQPDGSLPVEDLGCYYKPIFPLRSAGRTAEASTLLRHTMRLFYKEDGDLRDANGRKGSGTYANNCCQVYPNGWVALGAMLLGQFDIYKKLCDGIINNYYDEEIGAIRTMCYPKKSEEYDVVSSALCAEVLALYDLPKAERLCDFLIQMLDQHDETYFYSVATKPFAIKAVADQKLNPYGWVDYSQSGPGQYYYYFGMPSVALAQIYEITGKEKYLAASEEYYARFLSCGEEGLRAPGSGKSFWAGAILYRLTGKEQYKKACLALMDYFFKAQRGDGSFLLPHMTEADLTPKQNYNLIPEYARWFFEVAAELSGCVE
jgi:hypothetical protein